MRSTSMVKRHFIRALFLIAAALTPFMAYGSEICTPACLFKVCCDGVCTSPRSDIGNCGSCGNVCKGKDPVCDNGCCRDEHLYLPQTCIPEDIYDHTLTVPDIGAVDLWVRGYGGTPCSDHEVIRLLTPSGFWDRIVVTGSVAAEDACDCAGYQMHVLVHAPAGLGAFCHGSPACASCGSDASCCQIVHDANPNDLPCDYSLLHGVNTVERRVNGSWNGTSCTLAVMITREDGFEGAIGTVHASVMKKSTGETQPIHVRIHGTN